VVNI
jgi:rRNA 2'-O-methyltransferase fibrillarin